jgi:hypothetical protein
MAVLIEVDIDDVILRAGYRKEWRAILIYPD